MGRLSDLPTSPSLRVYVIDDDPAVLESTALLLDTFGFDCTTFGCAVEFLSKVDGLAPGCVLTDLRMPDIDGWALCSALQGKALGWPVLLMSSDNGAELQRRARESGFSGLIRKPVDADKLAAAIGGAIAAAMQSCLKA
jgi:two-component system response regulator FixJ